MHIVLLVDATMTLVQRCPSGELSFAFLPLAGVDSCVKSDLHGSSGSATCGGEKACESDEDVVSTLFRELTATDITNTPLESAISDPTGAWYEDDTVMDTTSMEPAVVPVVARIRRDVREQSAIEQRQGDVSIGIGVGFTEGDEHAQDAVPARVSGQAPECGLPVGQQQLQQPRLQPRRRPLGNGSWSDASVLASSPGTDANVPAPVLLATDCVGNQSDAQRVAPFAEANDGSLATSRASSSSRFIPVQKELTSMDLSAGLAEETSKDATGAWYETLKEPPSQAIVEIREAAEKEEQNHDSSKEALIEMGFNSEQTQAALERMRNWGGDVQEAANWLAEQAAAASAATGSLRPSSCTQAVSSFVTDWLLAGILTTAADEAEIESFRPGRYRIIVGHASSSSAQAGESLEEVKEGSIVEVAELQRTAAASNISKSGSNVVRGRLNDGRWISIASITGGRSHIWAKPVSVETQLLELGFPEDQAREAARRCSTVEAAVDYLACSSGSTCSASLRLLALQHVQQKSRFHRTQSSARSHKSQGSCTIED